MDHSSYKEKIVINQDYALLGDFLKKLPLYFEQEGDTVYDGRNIIKTFVVKNIHLNVKSFKTPHLINQFAYATLRKSKARRSYEYAQQLLQLEINTPAPIAYIEYSKPLLFKSSYYVSKHTQFDGEMRVLQKGTLEEHKELIAQFARFTAKLHQARVLHLDYSPGNILFKKEGSNYSFSLVDLNRMEFGKEINLKKAAENFQRLWGSDEMITFFTKEYASIRKFNESEFIPLVFKYRAKFWSRFIKRHPGETPYIDIGKRD